MRILFTGASSCTGMHIVHALIQNKHSVVCTFTKNLEEYSGITKERILNILPKITPLWNTSFGSSRFLKHIQSNTFDAYAHHMAWTKGYGTKYYPIKKAIENNTKNLTKVSHLLKEGGCAQIILTNSVFEGEYVHIQEGNAPFEAHGEAKKITTSIFMTESGIPVRRFIIPNPIGTHDNIRLLESLHLHWKKKQTPHINYPENIRDNLPIPLLTQRYVEFLEEETPITSPSGWQESNAAFISRVAKEFAKRFQYRTPIQLGPQKDHLQPLLLCNTQPVISTWNETVFWNELASHYNKRFTDTHSF